MEKNQYKLCLEVLRRLEKAGILKNVILVGSWCLHFYENYFAQAGRIASIKTRDIDFLIPNPSAIKSKTDVFELVKDLGFIVGFRGREGYIVLEHPELEIEFLVPEKGRGTNKPFPLPQLGLNAHALRFLEFLTQNTIGVRSGDVHLTLPHPIHFALHKLILASRRKQKDKAQRDRETGLKILNLSIETEKSRVRNIFNSLPTKWRRIIIKELEELQESNIIQILNS